MAPEMDQMEEDQIQRLADIELKKIEEQQKAEEEIAESLKKSTDMVNTQMDDQKQKVNDHSYLTCYEDIDWTRQRSPPSSTCALLC